MDFLPRPGQSEFLQKALCTICGIRGAITCSGCVLAVYCSEECQDTDWPTHQRLCDTYEEFIKNRRPSRLHHLAVYFPMKSESRRPELIWLPSVEFAKDCFEPKFDQFLTIPGYTNPINQAQHIVHGNVLRGRPSFPGRIFIRYLDNSIEHDNFVINETLYRGPSALCTNGWSQVYCKGPIVAHLAQGIDHSSLTLIDMDLVAYRDVIDFLAYCTGYSSMIQEPGLGNPLSRSVMAARSGKARGVRINCARDMHRRHYELEQVEVPKTHPVFIVARDKPLQVVESLNHRWLLKSYPLPEPFSPAESKNQALEALLLVRSPTGLHIPTPC